MSKRPSAQMHVYQRMRRRTLLLSTLAFSLGLTALVFWRAILSLEGLWISQRFAYWLSERFEQGFPLPGYSPDQSVEVSVRNVVAIAVGISLAMSAIPFILRHKFAYFARWLERQSLWRLSLYRTASITVVWFGVTFAYYPNTALHYLEYGIGGIMLFFAVQCIVTAAAWVTPDPRKVRPITLLSRDEVARINTYLAERHTAANSPPPSTEESDRHASVLPHADVPSSGE